ncbi:DUF551 domain-containing protein [Robbsia andropogonis]|uniref:DUF551 domain-containing protein n=1 Tax=Robbsia andropogonis TaxID=28092 RepID=UPI0009E5B6BA|nr:DUF551 domain-containing protein [Robbsia andropogonis]
MSGWIKVSDKLPPPDEPVLVLYFRDIRVGVRCKETPGFEDTFSSYDYWDDAYDDGQAWEWNDVTHWMPLPEKPEQS